MSEIKDDCLSAYVRDQKGLDEDYRVYRMEIIGEDRVKLTGALARPASRLDDRKVGEPVWPRPFREKSQMTISLADYREIFAIAKAEGRT